MPRRLSALALVLALGVACGQTSEGIAQDKGAKNSEAAYTSDMAMERAVPNSMNDILISFRFSTVSSDCSRASKTPSAPASSSAPTALS